MAWPYDGPWAEPTWLYRPARRYAFRAWWPVTGRMEDCPTENLLNIVLLDSQRGDYPGGPCIEALERMGITVIDTRLISEQSAPYYDNELLVTALLSLV